MLRKIEQPIVIIKNSEVVISEKFQYTIVNFGLIMQLETLTFLQN